MQARNVLKGATHRDLRMEEKAMFAGVTGRTKTLTAGAGVLGLHLNRSALMLATLLFLAPIGAAGVTIGNDDVSFVAVAYDYPSSGRSTWYYTVTSGAKPAISHVTFQLPTCMTVVGAGTWGPLRTNLVSGGGMPEIGTDPTTGIRGLKFDEGFDEGGVRNYYFTLDRNYADAPTLVATKASTAFDTGYVTGPSSTCGVAVGTPTPTLAASHTPSHTPTRTHTPTSVPTDTYTPTSTPTATHTPTSSHTPTSIPTDTYTPTSTPTATHTATSVSEATSTPIEDIGPTATTTPTNTAISPTPTANDPRAGGDTPTPIATSTSRPAGTATPVGAPDLSLSKRHSGSFRALRNGVYTLSVTNIGAGPTTGVITVIDSLPLGLGFVSGNGSGWSCSALASLVTCTSSAVLAPTDITTITLTVSVATSAAAVTVNTASVSTAGDANSTNNTASDSTNIMGTIAATPTPANTATATSIPATATPTQTSAATGIGATATPTRAGTATPTRTRTSVATPTIAGRRTMNVRMVAVGRVNPGSEMYYSIALVTYSRGTTPQVKAYLDLPPEVEVVSISPEPTTAPPAGASGEVFWDLGDLTGPANRPLEVRVRVSRYATLGTQFTSTLRIENGAGETYLLDRLSRVGRYEMPVLNKQKTDTVLLGVTAPRVARPGDAMTFKVSASPLMVGGVAAPQIRMMFPSGVSPQAYTPQPTAIERQPNGDTLCEWSLGDLTKKLRIEVDTVATRQVVPGDILQTFVTLNGNDGTQALVISTQGAP